MTNSVIFQKSVSDGRTDKCLHICGFVHRPPTVMHRDTGTATGGPPCCINSLSFGLSTMIEPEADPTTRAAFKPIIRSVEVMPFTKTFPRRFDLVVWQHRVSSEPDTVLACGEGVAVLSR